MISVLIRVERGVDALVVTLSSLVPAVADGLLCDAVILSKEADPAVERAADAMGATVVVDPEGSWAQGARHAKRDWIFCLADGDVPSEGWIRALDRFIALSAPERRFGRFQRATGLRQVLRDVFGPRGVRAGDLVHRSLMVAGQAPRPQRIGALIERDPVLGGA
jgi:hypothetical protein